MAQLSGVFGQHTNSQTLFQSANLGHITTPLTQANRNHAEHSTPYVNLLFVSVLIIYTLLFHPQPPILMHHDRPSHPAYR